MSDSPGHVPVMADEAMELLALREGDNAADLTVGAGGHTERILDATAPDGQVVGVDRDVRAIELAARRLERFGRRATFIPGNFTEVLETIGEAGIEQFDGILFDLGVSSMQLDDPKRGFSFQGDGPLDMRMSADSGRTAEDIVNQESLPELERIFREYGEEPRARLIAEKVVNIRQRTRITRTRELSELVRSVAGGAGKIHPATRVFQSIRIAVNGELDALELGLERAFTRLSAGGRLVVIAFHSLEDRIVKRFFRLIEKSGEGSIVTRKPILPTALEARENRRSRSARMRAVERGSQEA